MGTNADLQEGSCDSAGCEPAARRNDRVRLKSAWLFTWAYWDHQDIPDDNKLIAIISRRRSVSYVQELAEVLFQRNAGTAYDMAYLANRPHARRYSYDCAPSRTGGWYIGIIPRRVIYVRLVSNLCIERDQQALTETVRWTELEAFDVEPGRGLKQPIEPGEPRSLVRSSRAMLANDLRRTNA
jgi:hypothetical protein